MPLSPQPLLRLLLPLCLATFLATPALAAQPPASPLDGDAIERELTRLEQDVRVFRLPLSGVERDARRQAAERHQLERRVVELRAIARHHGLAASDWDGRWQELEGELGIQRSGAAAATTASEPATQGVADGTIRARLFRADDGTEIGGTLRLIETSSWNEYVGYGDGTGEVVVEAPPGSYYVQAYASYPHQDLLVEVLENVYCPSAYLQECDLAQATVITLAAGQTRSFDIRLDTKGKIEGRVRDKRTQAPIAIANVSVMASGQGYGDSGYVIDGKYSIGVVPGFYHVVVHGDSGYLSQVYSGILCSNAYAGCDFSSATLVQMVDRQTVSGIDFDMVQGGKLKGKVLDAATGLAINDALVTLAEENGFAQLQTFSTNGGFWEIGGIAPGRYLLGAGAAGHVQQFWPEQDCPFWYYCWELADPIPVAIETVQTGFDFRLNRKGSILGRLVDDQNGIGLAGGTVSIYSPVGEDDVEFRASVGTDSAGAFHLADLPPGEYYLEGVQSDYRPEAYQDVLLADFQRDPRLARKIQVASGRVTDGIEMRLTRLGRIEGRIVDAASGQAVTYCDVYLWRTDQPNAAIRRDSYCPDGEFSVGGLEPGEYFLGARSDSAGHSPTLLGAGPCNFQLDRNLCPLAQATRITLGLGDVRGGYELRLVAGASIDTLIVAGPGAASAPIGAKLVDAQDRPVGTIYSYPNYSFRFANLAPGDYWLAALGAPHNGNMLYPSGTCSRWYCDPRLGQKLTLAAGQQLTTNPLIVEPLAPYARCQESATTLCLDQGRYRVEAFWQDYVGQTGLGQSRRLTNDSGLFTFFGPNNIELVVKVLNGCDRDLGHRFWVFAGGLTNVGVRLRITDTLTGEVYERTNALGTTYPPLLDTAAFDTCDAPEPAATAAPATGPANATAAAPAIAVAPVLNQAVAATGPCPGSAYGELCLTGGRFKVRATYTHGSGDQLTPVVQISEDAGYAYFFSPDNVEILFKVLDACERYGHFWVFATGLTDVKSHLRIEDTTTGQVAIYGGFVGPFQPIIDTTTFACN